jgi:hypothetical protein
MSNVETINKHIASKFHYELKLASYDSDGLIIMGGEDVLFSNEIEITFRGIFSIICNTYWKLDTKIKGIELVTNTKVGQEINKKYGVEVGYFIFKLNNEENLDFFIIAESFEWCFCVK